MSIPGLDLATCLPPFLDVSDFDNSKGCGF